MLMYKKNGCVFSPLDLTEPVKAYLKGQIPLGRFGTAEEVADAALFLATNQYAHNCVLNLDGGTSAV